MKKLILILIFPFFTFAQVNLKSVGNQYVSGVITVNAPIVSPVATTANQVPIKSQLDLKADLASPILTGNPTATTATAGDNDTSIATTAFVTGGIATADASNVKLTGNQTVAGTKTFDNSLTTTSRLVVTTQSNATSTGLSVASGSATYPALQADASNTGSKAIRSTVISGADAIYVESNQVGSGGTASSMLLMDNIGASNDITPIRIKKQGVEVAKIDYLGNISGNTVTLANVLKLKAYTVATLPAGAVGDMAYVTDATAPTYNGTLTGGGAVKIPVFYDGTAWKAH